jgi:hypothetical protein
MESVYCPPTYIRCQQPLPVYYVNNTTEEVIMVDKIYVDWPVTYPAFNHRMAVYYRQVTTAKEQEKIL